MWFSPITRPMASVKRKGRASYAHEIVPQMLRDPLINRGPPACGALLLLGFVRLLRFLFGLLLGSPSVNRTWRILEIKLAQLAPDLLNLFNRSDIPLTCSITEDRF